MQDIITVQCHNLNLFLDDEKRIYSDFICCDSENGGIINIVAPIYKQIDMIYGNMEITKAFLKRLEYKLKLTLRLHSTKLTFVTQKGRYFLKTSLEDIYAPAILTSDGIKFRDNPLIINANVSKIFFVKKKSFLEFLIEEIDQDSNDLVQKVRRINVDKEVNSIYRNIKVKEKFKNKLNIKSRKKQAFFDALSQYLEGKTLAIEYDEHQGYSLWTSLEYFININGNNR